MYFFFKKKRTCKLQTYKAISQRVEVPLIFSIRISAELEIYSQFSTHILILVKVDLISAIV
jgi:hypothetical protein